MLLAGLTAVVVVGPAAPVAAVALVPATFDEHAGIAWYSSQGASLSDPESVGLSVGLMETDNRGSGSGRATASGVLPLPTELDLALFGGTNPSAIGGTVSVITRYQFALEGLPGDVPITLTTSGWVEVSSSLDDGWVGQTFARISYPGGQIQASNEDPFGGHNGRFSFDQTIPLNLAAGTAQTITIYLYSHGQGAGTDFFYSSHAFLDPVIQIDPAFRDRYRVVYSSGISGSSAVPEPSTSVVWLLLGVVGIGLGRRSRASGRA